VGHRAVAGLLCAALLGAGCGDKRDNAARGSPAPGESPARDSQARLTPAVAREFERLLGEQLANTGVPGLSVTVVFGDDQVWSGAAGDAVIEPRQPMTTRTAMAFDSVTKIATAALALRLVERGALALDDPIRRWYPAWRGDREATVRDLLSHTSGAADPGEARFEAVIRHPRDIVRRSLAVAPKPGPRTSEAVYSNIGFIIAGLILERASGEPLADAMRRELFGHPGGEGLALQPSERPRAPRAHAYWYPDGGAEPTDASDGSPYIPNRIWAGVAAAAGALAGDVPSLARWAHGLLGGRILAPRSLEEMTKFRPGAFWLGYGLGLAKGSAGAVDLWGHGGDGLGTHTDLWHAPRERITVAMSWNDGALDEDPAFLRALVSTALGGP
jgi:D-alanyl-D-alanine carboxypeptidase